MSSRSAKAKESLPLRYRLPNPPPIYVGRAVEAERLAGALERAPVAVVWGLGGLGKTALVLHTLHRRFPEAAARTLFIRLGPGDPEHQIKLEIVRALVAARRVEGVSFERLLADPELLVGMAIDLAEDAGLWLVLDDLHHAAADVSHALLADLTRYARRSRWLATSRVDPRHPDLAGQVIPLGAMDDADLVQLAQACAPDLRPPAWRAAVDAAGGSPWRVRQLVGGGGPADDLLEGVPEGARAALAVLAAVETALPAELLARLAPVPARDVLDGLERRGFLEPAGGGHRIHDAARGLLRAALGAPALAAAATEAARVLGDAEPTELSLEGLRLRLAGADLAGAEALLARRGEDLLAAGYAPRLWQLLEPARAPGLTRWTLRAGVELGEPGVVARLAPLPSPTPADELLWCRALLAAGDTRAAAERAAALRARPEAGEVGFAAGLLEARALGLLGRHRDLLDLVAHLEPAGDAARVRRDSYAAEGLAVLGRYDDAARLAAAALARLPELDGDARAEAGNQLLGVFLVTGDLGAAGRTLATLVSGDALLFQSRATLLYRALLGVSLGRLEESRALFRQLAPLFARATLPGLILEHGEIFRRLVAGELDDVRARVERATGEARAVGSPFFEDWCVIWRMYLAILDGQALQMPALRGDHPGLAGAAGLLRLLHEARRGAPAGEWPAGLPPIWSSVLGGMIRAFHAVWSARPADAVREIRESIATCRALGYRQFELEQQAFACEIDVLLGTWGELPGHAAALAQLADECSAERFIVEAAFHRMAAESPIPRPALLERWAALPGVAPMASRRARALLGCPVELDRVDEGVVAALRGRAGAWSLATLTGGEAWRPGWGLDGHRKEVWLPDGQVVELTQRPLMWDALVALAAAGGALTHEGLARALWGVGEYHPLRDSGRIHTLVNRIRKLIEVDPAAPRRLVTSGEGYRFGDAESVGWLRSR